MEANSKDNDKCYPEPYITVPPPVKDKKVGQLSQEQINQYFNEGYTIVENFFTREELQPCRNAISELVEELAQKLYKGGKINKLYREFGLFQRLTELEKAWPGSNILMFKQGKLPKAFQDLWCNKKFINMVEQIVGSDVSIHPVWNLRVKTPKNDFTTVPWHQDSAYFDANSYDHQVVTAWVPFLDTSEYNGGMQVVKNGHRLGKCATHTCCQGPTWYVMLEEDEMEKSLGVNMKEDIVTCEVPYGGFLLFNNMTPHRSLPNMSNDVRWSVDLRWQSPKENWGFYDIAEGIPLRTAENSDIKPDWEKFLKVNRKDIWQRKHFKEVLEADEFDLTVTGPWIGRWELVNHNQHTKAFTDNKI